LFTGIANEGGDHLETTHSRGRTPPLRRSNLLLQRNRIIGEVPNSRYRSVAWHQKVTDRRPTAQSGRTVGQQAREWPGVPGGVL